jgi:pyridoxal phosphate enzyme (YggS family)
MTDVVTNLNEVRARIAAAEKAASRPAGSVDLVAVSKTFGAEDIRPVLEAGQRVFGENRVQEAEAKWPALREAFDGIDLHLIGPLQSNKAKEAVALFDVIETVDREKLAAELAREMTRQGRTPRLYVQVNTGLEPQKAGIDPREAVAFVTRCRDVHGLAIEGLMCIPPADENPGPHFALLEKLAGEAGLARLSMGMSGDYETAIRFGATSVRVGSAIFGAR